MTNKTWEQITHVINIDQALILNARVTDSTFYR